MGVIFNGISQLGNEHLAVIRSSGVAVLQGFGYCGSLCKFNPDQSFWPLYRGWLLYRGDRYEGFHCKYKNTTQRGRKQCTILYVPDI